MKALPKILIVGALTLVVAGVVALKKRDALAGAGPSTAAMATAGEEAALARTADASSPAARLPKLLDLGAGKCVPCKLMAPILEELKQEYAGQFIVEFIDVWQDRDAGKRYGIEIIPTQIFFDPHGRELSRHVGFYGKEDILGKWKELGVAFGPGHGAGLVREEPLAPDLRPPERVCFMCGGEVDPKTKTVVKGRIEQRILCSPHCYFIHFSSLVGADPQSEDAKVRVADWLSGELIPATGAVYLYGMDDQGRPTIRALAARETAAREQPKAPAIILSWDVLRSKELAARCGFCDRAVYPEDACKVTVGGQTHTYGCCTHCALGVAARTGKDIEVEAYDGLSGEVIKVRTLNGMIATLDPATAVAWFGQKKNQTGHWVSAGCFKQGFFVNQENLRRWLEARPAMTGRQITIAQALADKMKLSPEQIAKACKLGECP